MDIDLKNINVSDIKEKLKAIDKKTLIKFGIGFGAIIIFLIGYYAILNPIVKKKKALFANKILKQNEIIEFENDIILSKKKLEKLKPEFEKSSTLFHSKEEVEGLYQSLSKYAGINGLTISKIEKKKPKPVMKSGVASQSEDQIKKEMEMFVLAIYLSHIMDHRDQTLKLQELKMKLKMKLIEY